MDPDSPRAALLKAVGLKTEFAPGLEDILESDAGTTVLVDASAENLKALLKHKDALKQFTSTGGWLLLWGLTPEGLADFNALVGVDHLLRPFRHEWVEMSAKPDALLLGLKQMDFWFVAPQIVAGQAGGGYVTRNDVFTYVVDLGDVAPFCKLPDPDYWGKDADGPGSDHWPPNLVNGRDTQWQQGFTILLDENQPTKWTMTLPREERIDGFSITPDAKYHKITTIKLGFGDGMDAIELKLKPEQTRQDFTFPPRKAKALTIEIAEWDAVGKANVVGVMNLWIKSERPKDFREKVQSLLNIGVLVKYPMGKGGLVLNQMKIVQAEVSMGNRTQKWNIFSTLVMNMLEN